MTALDAFLSQPVVSRIGWALVHFVWQGAAVALLLAIALLLLRRRSPNVRYLVGCAALLVMLAAPVVTMLIVSPEPGRVTLGEPLGFVLPEVAEPYPGIPLAEPPVTITEGPAVSEFQAPPITAPKRSLWERVSSAVEANLPWLVVTWLIGVIVFSIRLLGGWIRVHRMKGSGASPASRGLQQVLQRLSHQLRLTRPIRLLESALAQAPVAIGWLRPVILLPASALTSLTPQQLEAILAHELAHIRRYDYLINLFQTVIETLLFYHPAVHWVSHRIRVEREHCCDDLAVSVSGDSVNYARALAALAEPRRPKARLAVAARSGSLLNRIQRLLGERPAVRKRFFSKWLSGGIALAIILALVGVGAFRAQAKGGEPLPPNAYAPMLQLMQDSEHLGKSMRRFRLPTEKEAKELGDLWPSIPLEDNAAFHYVQVIRLLDYYDEPPGSVSGERPYDGNVAAWEDWIKRNQAALDAFEEALEVERCQVPVFFDRENGLPNSGGSFLASLRQLARTADDAGFLEELKGRPDVAVERYLQLIRLEQRLKQKSVQMVWLTGIAMAATGCRPIEHLLANAQLSEKTLRRIIAAAEAAEISREEVKQVIEHQRLFELAVLARVKDVEQWGPELAFTLGLPHDAPRPDDLNEYKALLRQFWDFAPGLMDWPVSELARKRVTLLDTLPEEMKAHPLLAHHIRAQGNYAARPGRMNVCMRALRVRAAIALYQKEYGRAPASLDELCPRYLKSVPVDPFSGQAIRYAAGADGWKLWSVGFDGFDDGGVSAGEGSSDFSNWRGPDVVCTAGLPSNQDHRERFGLHWQPPAKQLLFRLVSESPDEWAEEMQLAGTNEHLRVEYFVLMCEDHIESAEAQPVRHGETKDDVAFPVEVTLTPIGARKFAFISEQNVGRRLAIVCRGKLVAAPVIRSRTKTNKLTILSKDANAATDLLDALNVHSPNPTRAAPDTAKEGRSAHDYSAMLELYPKKGNLRIPTAEEIEKLGPLWPRVPPEENAAYWFVKAASSVAGKEFIPPGSASAADGQLYAGDVSALERWVSLNQPAFRLMQKGFAQEVCRPILLFSVEHGQPVPDLSFLAGIRHLARTCADAGFLAELQGKPDAAAGAYGECLRLGMALRQDGVLIQELVGIAASQIGQRNLDALAANGGLDQEALRTLIRRLRAAEVRSDEPATLWATELAYGEALMSFNKDPGAAIVYDMWRKQRAALTEIVGNKPLAELLQQNIVKDMAEIGTKEPGEAQDGTIPAILRAFEELGRLDVRLRATQIRAAIALYQKQHGLPPDTLSALVPGFLPSVPEDPFSGEPLRYARTGTGWKLWSVGPDNVDDGGEASLVDEKGWIGPDFVYTNKVRSSIDRRSHGKIKNLPEPSTNGDEPAWGEAVEGVRCGISEVEVMRQSAILHVSLRNIAAGEQEVVYQAPQLFLVAFDGKRYVHCHWQELRMQGTRLLRNKAVGPIYLKLKDYIRYEERMRGADSNKPLTYIAPGEHKVRVTYGWQEKRPVPSQLVTFQILDQQTLRPPGAHDAYLGATRLLADGAPRDEAAKRFQQLADQYPDSDRGKISKDLAQMLTAMHKEDRAFREPKDAETLSNEERIKYYVFKLRDVAEENLFVPGRVWVLAYPKTPDSAAIALRRMGKVAVPTLMELLDDSRPTRSVEAALCGGHVLRYGDVALQVMEGIAARRFNLQTGRGAHLMNTDSATRIEIVSRVMTWWRQNRDKTEAEWLRDALPLKISGDLRYRQGAAERLIELEGPKSIAFFRKRIEAEPDNASLVRLLWQAGGMAVLQDIRPKMSSEYFYVRAAAYRALLEAGEPGIVDQVITDLEKLLEHPEKIDPSYGSGMDSPRDYCRSLLGLLIRSNQEKGILTAAQLMQHKETAVAKNAIAIFQYALRDKGKLAPEHRRLVFPYVAAALYRDELKQSATFWMIKAADLPIEWPEWQDPKSAEKRDAAAEQVRAWWEENKHSYPQKHPPAGTAWTRGSAPKPSEKAKQRPQPTASAPEQAEELRFFQYDVRDLLVDTLPNKLLKKVVEAVGKENWDAAGVIMSGKLLGGVPGVPLKGVVAQGSPGRLAIVRRGYLIVNNADAVHEQVKAALTDLRKAAEELVIRIRFVQPDDALLKLLEQYPPLGTFTVRTPDGTERQMQTPFQISYLPKDVIVRDGILAEARVFAKVGQMAKGSVGMYVPKSGEPETRTFRELAYKLTADTLLRDDKYVMLQLGINNVTSEAEGAAATKTWSGQIRLPFNGSAVLKGLKNLGSDVLILLSVRRVEHVELSELPKKPPQLTAATPEPTEKAKEELLAGGGKSAPPKLLVETVMKFIAAADSGDAEAAKGCYRPGPDAERQAKRDVREWGEFRKANPDVKFRPVSVYWTDNRALVLTNSFRANREDADRRGAVALGFRHWSEADKEGWGIRDIAIEPLDFGLRKRIERFLRRDDDSKHWFEKGGPVAEASKSIEKEFRDSQAWDEEHRKPTRLPLDGSTEFVGHQVTDFPAEIAKLKAEIAESATPTQEGPQVLLEMRDITIKAAAGEKAESPYEPMTVLSAEEYQALVKRVKSTKFMTTVSAPHLIVLSGKRQLLNLCIQGSYISGYTVKDGFAIPVLEGYVKSGCYVDAEVIVDGDAVVFKRLRYKNVAADLRPRSATFSVGDEPESKTITVNVSELVATTYTATLEKPEEVRLKSGETLVLPYQVTLERGFSNLRSLLRDDEFREIPQSADQVYDPNKTVRLILVTATILESDQPDLPNPAKEHGDSTPEPAEEAEEQARPGVKVKGVVVDEDGKPVAGASIKALAYRRIVGESQSKEDGSFELSMQTAMLKFVTLTATVDDGSRQGFQDFHLAPHLFTAEDARIVLRPSRKITVHVRDKDGNLVPEAGVEVSWFLAHIAARTDANGRAVLQVPQDANVSHVIALKSGVGFDYFKNRVALSPRKRGPPPVKLAFTLNGATTIRIEVRDSDGHPVHGARFYPHSITKQGRGVRVGLQGSFLAKAETDAQGMAVFDWLPADQANGYDFRLDRGTPYFCPKLGLVQPPVKDYTLSVRLYRDVRIGGRVLLPDGKPAAGILVTQSGHGKDSHGSGGEYTALTDADGRYQFDIHPNHIYMIGIFDDSWAALPHTGVIIREGEPRKDLDFHLDKGTFIRGAVTVGEEREPVTDQHVGLTFVGPDIPDEFGGRSRQNLIWWKQTDEKGRYAFRAWPGEYEMHVWPGDGFKIDVGSYRNKIAITVEAGKDVVQDFELTRSE